MTDKPLPIRARNASDTMRRTCDICGKLRGGTMRIDHSACSKLRQAQGFEGKMA